MTVTFSRTRPVESVNPIGAATRRREGTLALELESPERSDVSFAAENGLLVVSHTLTDVEPAAWVLSPEEALKEHGRPGWRLTLLDDGDGEAVLDAAARTRCAFVRTGRSTVESLAARLSLPGLSTSVSVFVDDVEQGLAAVAAGASDLLLRDWDAERIGQLRDALGGRDLIERSVFGPVSVDEARAELPGDLFAAWLRQVDASGWARPRVDWAPGDAKPIPVRGHRFSSAWTDEAWVSGRPLAGLAGAGPLFPILEASLEGKQPDVAALEALLGARGDQVDAVVWTADRLRARTVGDEATYVVNRNINYTNLCYFRCGFCAFSKGPRSLDLRGEPYLMGLEEIVGNAVEAWERGATEVTLQGGIHPDFTGDFYAEVVEAIKAALPQMHIHGFTPLEVWQGAHTLGVTVKDFLIRLRDAGLGTLPGTAAEILDDRVREHLCPDKIRTSQWADVMITAHELGLRATATIMFGHIDDPASWARHLEVIRAIQRRTGGFTEMVPLPFVHMGSPIYLRGRARPGPTWDEVVLIHAVSRIAFDGSIPNIQASWVKLGTDGAARMLGAGANDIGGTLMGERITRAAGAAHGQEMSPEDLEGVIRSAGRQPRRRDTVYGVVQPSG